MMSSPSTQSSGSGESLSTEEGKMRARGRPRSNLAAHGTGRASPRGTRARQGKEIQSPDADAGEAAVPPPESPKVTPVKKRGRPPGRAKSASPGRTPSAACTAAFVQETMINDPGYNAPSPLSTDHRTTESEEEPKPAEEISGLAPNPRNPQASCSKPSQRRKAGKVLKRMTKQLPSKIARNEKRKLKKATANTLAAAAQGPGEPALEREENQIKDASRDKPKSGAVRKPRSAVRKPRSAVRKPPSAVPKPRSAVPKPRSAVPKPPSDVPKPPTVHKDAQRIAFLLSIANCSGDFSMPHPDGSPIELLKYKGDIPLPKDIKTNLSETLTLLANASGYTIYITINDCLDINKERNEEEDSNLSEVHLDIEKLAELLLFYKKFSVKLNQDNNQFTFTWESKVDENDENLQEAYDNVKYMVQNLDVCKNLEVDTEIFHVSLSKRENDAVRMRTSLFNDSECASSLPKAVDILDYCSDDKSTSKGEECSESSVSDVTIPAGHMVDSTEKKKAIETVQERIPMDKFVSETDNVDEQSRDLQTMQNDLQPVLAEFPPVQADLQPVQCDLQPVHADLQPMQADLQPVQANLQPVQADLQPVQAGLQPVQADLQPVQADLQPVQAGLQPVQADLQPVQADLQPVQAGLQPVQAGLQPMQVDLQPMQVELQPMQADLQPVQVDLQPMQADLQPDLQPVQVDLQPMQADLQPVQVDPQPMQADLQPVQVDLQPMQADLQPVQADLQPVQPDLQPVQPDLQPIQADLQSVQADLRPVQADIQPVQANLQPVQADIQPVRADLKPDHADLQPMQTDLQPVRADIQPVKADLPSMPADFQVIQSNIKTSPKTSDSNLETDSQSNKQFKEMPVNSEKEKSMEVVHPTEQVLVKKASVSTDKVLVASAKDTLPVTKEKNKAKEASIGKTTLVVPPKKKRRKKSVSKEFIIQSVPPAITQVPSLPCPLPKPSTDNSTKLKVLYNLKDSIVSLEPLSLKMRMELKRKRFYTCSNNPPSKPEDLAKLVSEVHLGGASSTPIVQVQEKQIQIPDVKSKVGKKNISKQEHKPSPAGKETKTKGDKKKKKALGEKEMKKSSSDRSSDNIVFSPSKVPEAKGDKSSDNIFFSPPNRPGEKESEKSSRQEFDINRYLFTPPNERRKAQKSKTKDRKKSTGEGNSQKRPTKIKKLTKKKSSITESSVLQPNQQNDTSQSANHPISESTMLGPTKNDSSEWESATDHSLEGSFNMGDQHSGSFEVVIMPSHQEALYQSMTDAVLCSSNKYQCPSKATQKENKPLTTKAALDMDEEFVPDYDEEDSPPAQMDGASSVNDSPREGFLQVLTSNEPEAQSGASIPEVNCHGNVKYQSANEVNRGSHLSWEIFPSLVIDEESRGSRDGECRGEQAEPGLSQEQLEAGSCQQFAPVVSTVDENPERSVTKTTVKGYTEGTVRGKYLIKESAVLPTAVQTTQVKDNVSEKKSPVETKNTDSDMIDEAAAMDSELEEGEIEDGVAEQENDDGGDDDVVYTGYTVDKNLPKTTHTERKRLWSSSTVAGSTARIRIKRDSYLDASEKKKKKRKDKDKRRHKHRKDRSSSGSSGSPPREEPTQDVNETVTGIPTGTRFVMVGRQLLPIKRKPKPEEETAVENESQAGQPFFIPSMTGSLGEAKKDLLYRHLSTVHSGEAGQRAFSDDEDTLSIHAPSDASFLDASRINETYDEIEDIEKERDWDCGTSTYQNPYIVDGKLIVPVRRHSPLKQTEGTKKTIDNTAVGTEQSATVTTSSAAVSTSNAPVSTSNAAVSAANAAVTAANAAVTASNAAVTTSNAAVTASNAAVTASNAAVTASSVSGSKSNTSASTMTVSSTTTATTPTADSQWRSGMPQQSLLGMPDKKDSGPRIPLLDRPPGGRIPTPPLGVLRTDIHPIPSSIPPPIIHCRPPPIRHNPSPPIHHGLQSVPPLMAMIDSVKRPPLLPTPSFPHPPVLAPNNGPVPDAFREMNSQPQQQTTESETPPWMRNRPEKVLPTREPPPWARNRRPGEEEAPHESPENQVVDRSLETMEKDLREAVEKTDWDAVTSIYFSTWFKCQRAFLTALGSILLEKNKDRISHFGSILGTIMSRKEMITDKVLKNISAMGVSLIYAVGGVKHWAGGYVVVKALDVHHIPYIKYGYSANCPDYEVLYRAAEICMESNDANLAMKLLENNRWLRPKVGAVKERQFRAKRIRVLKRLIDHFSPLLPSSNVHKDLLKILDTLLRTHNEDMETVPEIIDRKYLLGLIFELVDHAHKTRNAEFAFSIHGRIHKNKFRCPALILHRILTILYECRVNHPKWLDKAGELAIEACHSGSGRLYPGQDLARNQLRISASMYVNDIHMVVHGFIGKLMRECLGNMRNNRTNDFHMTIYIVGDEHLASELRRTESSSRVDAQRNIRTVILRQLSPPLKIMEDTLVCLIVDPDSLARHIQHRYEVKRKDQISKTVAEKPDPVQPQEVAVAASSQVAGGDNERVHERVHLPTPCVPPPKTFSQPQQPVIGIPQHQQPVIGIPPSQQLQMLNPVMGNTGGLTWPEQMMLNTQNSERHLMPPPSGSRNYRSGQRGRRGRGKPHGW